MSASEGPSPRSAQPTERLGRPSSGSWVPLAGSAGILLIMLVLVLLATQFGEDRSDRLTPAPTPTSTAED